MNEINSNTISCQARQVQIGDFKTGASAVIITSSDVIFWAQNAESGQKVEIQMNHNQIGKIIFCDSETTIVLFIYPLSGTVRQIRESLNLSEEFFRSCTLTNKLSLILLVIPISEQSHGLSAMLRDIYEYKFEKLEMIQATDLLKDYDELLLELSETTAKTPGEALQSRTSRILSYPPNGRSQVIIYANDFIDLTPKTYLNDAIIDFYIKYLTLEVLTQEQRERVHVFDSFFYKSLTTAQEEISNDLSAEEKAFQKYKRVSRWDEKVNLFEKDFIFVPINLHDHWFLAVICFPRLQGKTLHFQTREEVDIKTDKHSPIIQSCLLIFDSLGIDRPNVSTALRNYLHQRFLAEHDGLRAADFKSKTMPGCYVKAPCQNNSYDCGLYVLQYVESFFRSPIQDFRTPIKHLEKWFSRDVIGGKRQYIYKLVERLVSKYEPNNLPLPQIEFEMNDSATNEDFVEILDNRSPPSKQEIEDEDWTPYNIATQ